MSSKADASKKAAAAPAKAGGKAADKKPAAAAAEAAAPGKKTSVRITHKKSFTTCNMCGGGENTHLLEESCPHRIVLSARLRCGSLTALRTGVALPLPLPLLRCRVVQKKAMENINSRLALVMKSGKYTLGYKSTLKTLRQGKGQ